MSEAPTFLIRDYFAANLVTRGHRSFEKHLIHYVQARMKEKFREPSPSPYTEYKEKTKKAGEEQIQARENAKARATDLYSQLNQAETKRQRPLLVDIRALGMEGYRERCEAIGKDLVAQLENLLSLEGSQLVKECKALATKLSPKDHKGEHKSLQTAIEAEQKIRM